MSLGHVVSGIRHVCIYDPALARGSAGRGLMRCWMEAVSLASVSVGVPVSTEVTLWTDALTQLQRSSPFRRRGLLGEHPKLRIIYSVSGFLEF